MASFLACHEEVKVLEELDDFLEQEIRALAQKRGLSVKILGKEDPEEWIGEYTASGPRWFLKSPSPKPVSPSPTVLPNSAPGAVTVPPSSLLRGP